MACKVCYSYRKDDNPSAQTKPAVRSWILGRWQKIDVVPWVRLTIRPRVCFRFWLEVFLSLFTSHWESSLSPSNAVSAKCCGQFRKLSNSLASKTELDDSMPVFELCWCWQSLKCYRKLPLSQSNTTPTHDQCCQDINKTSSFHVGFSSIEWFVICIIYIYIVIIMFSFV